MRKVKPPAADAAATVLEPKNRSPANERNATNLQLSSLGIETRLAFVTLSKDRPPLSSNAGQSGLLPKLQALAHTVRLMPAALVGISDNALTK
jgi:hypothetical protein